MYEPGKVSRLLFGIIELKDRAPATDTLSG